MNMNLISEISINGSPRIGYIYNQCKKMGLWEPFERGEAKISFTFNGRRLYFKNSKQYKLFRMLYIEFKKAGMDTNEFLDSMPNVIKINEENYSVQNMRNVIRLTESDLHRLVKSSVNRILRENMFDNPLNQTDIDGEPIDDEDEDITPEVGYGGDIDDLDIGMNGADDNNYGFKSPFTGLRGYNGDDREFLDNATYEPDFNYYDNYDDIDMDDRAYENYIQNANESRNIIGRALRESINNVLKKKINEGIKAVDPNNVVPEDLARKLGFKPEYSDRESGLEIWGKQVNPMSAKKYLDYLGISHFTTNNVNGNIRITVKPNPKQDFGRSPKKIGNYVTTEYGDERGEIFHNPKNGHIRRLNNRGEFK